MTFVYPGASSSFTGCRKRLAYLHTHTHMHAIHRENNTQREQENSSKGESKNEYKFPNDTTGYQVKSHRQGKQNTDVLNVGGNTPPLLHIQFTTYWTSSSTSKVTIHNLIYYCNHCLTNINNTVVPTCAGQHPSTQRGPPSSTACELADFQDPCHCM